jgi:hypothetical protein
MCTWIPYVWTAPFKLFFTGKVPDVHAEWCGYGAGKQGLGRGLKIVLAT